MEGITLKGKSKPAQLDICRVAAYLNNRIHSNKQGRAAERNGVKSTIDPCRIKCYMLQHVTTT